MLRTSVLHADGRVERDVPVTEAYRLPEGSTAWVDMEEPTAEELELLRKRWSFHPLAVEDCVHHQRLSKIERYPTHGFVVFHALDRSTPDVPLDTIAVRVFIRPGMIVTVHPKGSGALEHVWDALKLYPERVGSTSERLMHAVLDAIVDDFMKLLYEYEERVDELEDRAGRAHDRRLVHDLVRMRRDLLFVRRIVLPQREVVRRFIDADDTTFTPEGRVYFRDVLDHIEVIHDTTNLLLEVCNGALQVRAEAVNERLNQVMKYLAVVSTLLLPMTVISGAFGMNFKEIPLADHVHGFGYAILMMLVSALALLVVFRVRRWF